MLHGAIAAVIAAKEILALPAGMSPQVRNLSHFSMCYRLLMFLLGGCVAWLIVWQGPTQTALAQGSEVQVRYDEASKTIVLGAPYRADEPSEAPFVGQPAQPGAPKQVVTIPALAAALTATGAPDLLVEESSGVWLLKAHLTIEQNSQLEATRTTISEWRIDSLPYGPAPGEVADPNNPYRYLRVLVNGGTLLIDGIAVTSWNSHKSEVDSNVVDGRSYISAVRGARMDVINAEVAWLGYDKREAPGLSWRNRADSDRPESAATGQVINSKIHHNYYGLYAFDALGVQIEGNQIFDNLYYGALISRSREFVISNNEFYNNRGHGLLLSRQSEANRIENNSSHHNGWSGIGLYRGSDANVVTGNTVFENGKSGIVVYQSSLNQIVQNTISDNRLNGINVNAIYDETDLFDALAVENTLAGNTISGGDLGICLYARADHNTLANNTISGTQNSGIAIYTGGNDLTGNHVISSEWGILIEGGPVVGPRQGMTPATPALEKPGKGNLLMSNIVEQNRQGIVINRGESNVLGRIQGNNQASAGNRVQANLEHGIYLSNTVNTRIAGNQVLDNTLNGITVIAAESQRNLITQNSISGNGNKGIAISSEVEQAARPLILSYENGLVSGAAEPNSRVEIYRDPTGQGHLYKGVALANEAGTWSFLLADGFIDNENNVTALATDLQGNTSSFSEPYAVNRTAIVNASSFEQIAGIDMTNAQQDCSSDITGLSEGEINNNGAGLVKNVWLPVVWK